MASSIPQAPSTAPSFSCPPFISEDSLSLSDIKIFAAAITHNTTLTSLTLSGHGFGDEGAKYLADALTHNTTLTYLDLSGNNITSKGAGYLDTALTTNTTLKRLELGSPRKN